MEEVNLRGDLKPKDRELSLLHANAFAEAMDEVTCFDTRPTPHRAHRSRISPTLALILLPMKYSSTTGTEGTDKMGSNSIFYIIGVIVVVVVVLKLLGLW